MERPKNFQEALERGIKEREEGNINESIRLLRRAVKLAQSDAGFREKADARSHLGLAFFLRGTNTNNRKDLDRATMQWYAAFEMARSVGDESAMATCLRNLSRRELQKSSENFDFAFEQAREAVDLARKYERKDLVWFLHGLFSACFYSDRKGMLGPILKDEKRALIKCWNKVSKMERRVWAGGYLMDVAVYREAVSKPVLIIARSMMRLLGLKRRVEQIDRVLSSM
jgi:hypothetical protein